MDKEINDIKIYDELFLFWLNMKKEKDSSKRDEVIVKTASNIEKVLQEQKQNIREKVEGMRRKLEHPDLRYKGKVCDACSEDFTHNQTLDDVLKLI